MAGMIWVENNHYNRVKAEASAAARRKQEADRKRRAEKDRLSRQQREAQRAAEQDAQQLDARLQAETDRLLEGIDNVSYEMRAALRQHVEQTHQAMDGLRQSVLAVEQRAVALDGKIDNLEASVAARFQALANAMAQEASRARLYANQHHEILTRINGLHPQMLTPGAVENDLNPVQNFLNMDLENEDYQAAIALAQSKIPEALNLQVRLEQLNAQFRELQQQASALIEELQQRTRHLQDASANQRIVTVDGNEYEYDGLISYWTNDLFLVVLENYRDTLQHYTVAEQNMDLDAMAQAIDRLDQVAIQLTECEELAADEFQLFAMVQNMVAAIHNVLSEDNSWNLTESGFVDDDSRRAYHLTYTDGDDDTASIVVLPNREVTATGKPGEVQFLVSVCDSDNVLNPFRCQILRTAILARLEQENICLGAHNRDPQYGTGQNREAFLQEATRQADDIKENRLAIIRRQLELNDQREEIQNA